MEDDRQDGRLLARGTFLRRLVQDPDSNTEREKTGQYLAHKSRTESFCSSVNVEQVNALDKGPSSSDLARRTEVFATTLAFNDQA